MSAQYPDLTGRVVVVTADGLHPTPEGQRVILTTLVDALSGAAVDSRPETA